jgi:divalent metal cation (Fe/Co/Zn/Cd) transporter
VVAVEPGHAIVEGHATADEVESAVRGALPGSDVVVHVEPRREGLDLRQRVLAVALSEPLVREAHDVTLYEHDGRTSVSLHLKLPRGIPLAEAHAVAERVEAELEADPGIAQVHTHLEPLEQPLVAEPAGGDEGRRIRAIVERRAGVPPREMELVRTDGGLVVFVTVGLGEAVALPDAHELASRIEDDIRRAERSISDVVVHTEP